MYDSSGLSLKRSDTELFGITELSTPFLPHPIRSKGGFKALPPKAIS